MAEAFVPSAEAAPAASTPASPQATGSAVAVNLTAAATTVPATPAAAGEESRPRSVHSSVEHPEDLARAYALATQRALVTAHIATHMSASTPIHLSEVTAPASQAPEAA